MKKSKKILMDQMIELGRQLILKEGEARWGLRTEHPYMKKMPDKKEHHEGNGSTEEYN